MVVQRATIFEEPQIEGLRRAFFDRWDERVHRRPKGTIWWIAREGERVLACTSYLDGEDGRAMQDFYCVDGPIGVRALRKLRDTLFAKADDDRMRLIIPCNPLNAAMLRAYGWTVTVKPTRHSQGLTPVAVILIREPKGDA